MKNNQQYLDTFLQNKDQIYIARDDEFLQLNVNYCTL